MANLQGHNEPAAWKCANCGNTSDCQGVGQGDNWCNSCAVCGQMQPLYAAPPAAPAPAAPVPDGWVMVPREPTPEMIAAMPYPANTIPAVGVACYRAMIAASPAAPVVREPHQLTKERLQRHALFAADAPPSSAVVLLSSLHRLLGITGASK